MTRYSFMLIVIACIGISTCIAFAEQNAVKGGTIRGRALEYGKTQPPIEGVIIKVINADGKEHTVKTDAKGEFKFTNLPAGNYTLKYLQEGFGNKGRGSQSVSVVNEGNQVVELKMVNWLNSAKKTVEYRILPLLYHTTANIANHFNLDETVVSALRQSIRESIETAIKQGKNLSIFTVNWNDSNIDVLKWLLSRPDIKAAFTKYLTETQLQDYNDFTNTRLHREKQAIAFHLTALLDQELIFTADQRQKVVQLILDTKRDESSPDLRDMGGFWLGIDSSRAVDMVHDEMKISLDEVLTKAQKKIRQLAEEENTEASIRRQIHRTQNAIVTDRVKTKIATARLEELKKKAEMLESPERTKQLAEAILAAHTDQLGVLNEHASQQLTLITKIVAQKYFEVEKVMTLYRETEASLINGVEAKETTPEQAVEKLKDLSEKLWNEKDANEQSGGIRNNTGLFNFHFFTRFTQIAAHRRALINGIVGGIRGFNPDIYITTELNYPTYDITYHSLYQQTLKDILSEEDYAQYTTLQAERENFRQQALRNIAVVVMDLMLLLDDAQRKQIEMIVAPLTVPSLGEALIQDSPLDMFYKLYDKIDMKMLSTWQRHQLNISVDTMIGEI